MKRFKTLKSYTLYTLLVAFLMVGCEMPTEADRTEKAIEDYKVQVIDGCEYILIYRYRQDFMAHKGNCKNH